MPRVIRITWPTRNFEGGLPAVQIVLHRLGVLVNGLLDGLLHHGGIANLNVTLFFHDVLWGLAGCESLL